MAGTRHARMWLVRWMKARDASSEEKSLMAGDLSRFW